MNTNEKTKTFICTPRYSTDYESIPKDDGFSFKKIISGSPFANIKNVDIENFYLVSSPTIKERGINLTLNNSTLSNKITLISNAEEPFRKLNENIKVEYLEINNSFFPNSFFDNLEVSSLKCLDFNSEIYGINTLFKNIINFSCTVPNAQIDCNLFNKNLIEFLELCNPKSQHLISEFTRLQRLIIELSPSQDIFYPPKKIISLGIDFCGTLNISDYEELRNLDIINIQKIIISQSSNYKIRNLCINNCSSSVLEELIKSDIPKRVESLTIKNMLLDDNFFNYLHHFSEIRELDISNSSLKEFPRQLLYLNNLEKIDISETMIGCIPYWIIQLKKLREIVANYRNIRDPLMLQSDFTSDSEKYCKNIFKYYSNNNTMLLKDKITQQDTDKIMLHSIQKGVSQATLTGLFHSLYVYEQLHYKTVIEKLAKEIYSQKLHTKFKEKMLHESHYSNECFHEALTSELEKIKPSQQSGRIIMYDKKAGLIYDGSSMNAKKSYDNDLVTLLGSIKDAAQNMINFINEYEMSITNDPKLRNLLEAFNAKVNNQKNDFETLFDILLDWISIIVLLPITLIFKTCKYIINQ